jgi:hypothetical protein
VCRPILGTFNEPTVGDDFLHPRDTAAIMDCIQQHEGQDLADPRERAQAVERLCLMRLGRRDKSQLQGGAQAVVRVDQREVHRDALLDGWIGKPFSHAVSVALVGQSLADFREVVLAVRIVGMSQPLGSFAHERQAAPEEVAGGAPLGGRDIGLGEHPAAQEDGDLVGSDLVVFGLAPMDGLHVEGVAQDEGNPLAGTEIGQPVPREDAFDADDEILLVGCNSFQQWCGGCLHISMQQDLSVPIHNTDVHGPGMQIDATVKFVLFSRDAPEVSSSS